MKSNKRFLLFITIIAVCMLTLGSFAYAKAPVLRMATTTSTDNTGLLDQYGEFEDLGLNLVARLKIQTSLI